MALEPVRARAVLEILLSEFVFGCHSELQDSFLWPAVVLSRALKTGARAPTSFLSAIVRLLSFSGAARFLLQTGGSRVYSCFSYPNESSAVVLSRAPKTILWRGHFVNLYCILALFHWSAIACSKCGEGSRVCSRTPGRNESTAEAICCNRVGRRRIDSNGASRTDNLKWRAPLQTPSNLFQGLILKMARLINEDVEGIQVESAKEAARKPPIRNYVIKEDGRVQIIATDVSLSANATSHSQGQMNRSHVLMDAVLSQGRHRESDIELMPRKAGTNSSNSEDTSSNLNNTCSFDGELYTTKFIRGPQVCEREREVQRTTVQSTKYVFYFLLWLWALMPSVRAIAPETQALLEIKSGFTKSDSLTSTWNVTNVDSSGCPLQWYGVRTDLTNGCHVLELLLPSSGLVGTIAPSIGRLQSLVNLSLAQNDLTGDIFTIVKLPQLVRLFLSGNSLSGAVQLGIYSKLMVIDLSDNKFSGPILPPFPESLSHVDFSGNAFSGIIPEELGQATGLKTLDLSRNKLEGPIPAMPLVVSLSILRLSDNMLTGQIPSELFNEQTPQLQEVDLSRNRLTGNLGPVSTKVMSVLRLASNNLTGPLPSKLQSCRVVDLSNNHFTGGLALSKWSANLRILDLSHNNLSGIIDNASLIQLFVLASLNLSSNQLSGPIPSKLFAFPSITDLVLSHNLLQGPIPAADPSTAALSPLRVLDLSDNQLSDPIPETLGSFSELLVLSLSSNQLGGIIPEQLSNLSKLQSLDLSKNLLIGPIPAKLSSRLNHLNVSINNLSGSVPPNLASFPTSSFYPGNPNLSFPRAASSNASGPGVVTQAESDYKRVNTAMKIGLTLGITLGAALIALCCLVAYYYKTLKPSLKFSAPKSCQESNEPREGSNVVVEQTDACPPVEIVTVKGALAPSKARNDIKRDALDLQKSAESPMRSVWRTAGAPSDDVSVADEHPMVLKVKSPDRLAGDLFFLDATLLFTAEELSRAPAEVLGRSNHGTSYKATLDNGHVLTVKWLREGLARNRKEFTREAKRFGGIKHPNIVSLRGYYWGPREHEKLLLSDFISLGSLAHHLYERTGRSHPPLTWVQRLQIAVGVASGLSYLHNKHGVAHGNLKANNVLLRGPQWAQLSDYSLHRLMTAAGTTNQILNAGALGYRPPELSATRKPKPTLEADVYALGVVLLELITGKSAGNIMSANSGAVDLQEWVRLVVKESRPVDCYDTEIVGLHRENEPPGSMHEVLTIALSCVTPHGMRPTVKCIHDQLIALAEA